MRAASSFASLVVALAALAGCAGPSACEPPFPLDLRAYPSVAVPSIYEVQTTLWNCTSDPIPVDDPCALRDGLLPAIRIGDETYFLGFGANGTAHLRDDVTCFEHTQDIPPRTVVEPGAYVEQRYPWNGTYRPAGGAPEPVPPGSYVVFARAGPHYDSAVIDAPWASGAP